MKKRFIYLFMVLVFLFTSINTNVLSAVTISTFPAHPSYNDWSGVDETYLGTSVTGDVGSLFDRIRTTLPAGTRAIENGKRFNYYLWFDKSIVVYGKPTYVPDNKQDFVSATQIAVGNIVDNQGYYKVGSEKGEYRYHGYTKDGGLYTNINFPDDATSTTELTNKRWYYKPWENPYLVSNNKPSNISSFNDIANGISSTSALVRNWISKGVPFAITKQWNISGGKVAGTSDKYNYMYVQSPPTKAVAGEGRMWHKTASKTWYDTMPIPAIEATPDTADCTLQVLTNDTNFPKKTGKAAIDNLVKNEVTKVKVKVTGAYDDSAYYNDTVKRTTYYTRDDIYTWELTLQVNGGTVKKKSGSNVSTTDKNAKCYIIFEVYVTVQQLWDAGGNPAKLPIKATAQCSFRSINNDKSVIGIANGFITAAQKNDTTIDMDFFGNVSPEIQEVDGTKDAVVWVAFNADVSNYTNASNIKSWHMEADFGGTKATPKDMAGDQLSINNDFGFSVSKTKFLANFTYKLPITVTVKVELKTKVNGILHITKSKTFGALFYRGIPPVDGAGDIQGIINENPPPVFVDCKPTLPTPAFDIEPYACSDATDMSTVSESNVNVINQNLSHDQFFNGTFIFGDNNIGFQPIKINYTSIDGYDAIYSTFIYVYSTKPYVNIDITGRSCINRKLTFTADAVSATAPKVLAKYPITSYTWTVKSDEGKDTAIKINGSLSSNSFSALFKEVGQYTATLVVTNAAGKTSDVFSYKFYISDDTPPGMAIGLKNSAVSRGESISAYAYDISSADGDTIAATSIELWYDSDNNGTYDSLKQTWSNPASFPNYTATQLGSYRFVVKATEEFGQETIPAFVTPADRKSTIKTYDVICDNLVPMSGVFIEKPVVRPQVDMFIMMDADLNNTKTSWITDNRVNIINDMGYNNVIANVQHWDMHTYIDTQNVSYSVDYGTIYPDASRWYDSGGYTGTVPRSSVTPRTEWGTRPVSKNVTTTKTFNGSRSNSRTYTIDVTKNAPVGGAWSKPLSTTYNYSSGGYTGTLSGSWTLNPASAADFGIGVHTQTASITYSGTVKKGTLSKTATHSASSSRTVTVTGTYYISGYSEWSTPGGMGTTYDINQEGYVGSIPRTTTTYSPDESESAKLTGKTTGTYTQTATASYSGELSKTETIIEWESYSYTAYTGNYAGSVTKPYHQTYFDPYSASSDKYLIYVSDGGITQLNDFKTAKSKTDAKIILIGTSAITGQTGYDKFILNDGSKPIDKLINDAEEYILSKYSLINKYMFTINEDTFELKNDDVDAENDPIIEGKYQYVQNPNYFDNNMGYDVNATSSLNDGSWNSTILNKFTKPGEYKVYRRIKDKPSNDPNFADFSYLSGTPYLIMYAQRRPIASAWLNWDFDAALGVYKTTWVDTSYDLDHQYNRPSDKGIIDRKIMYRLNGGEWIYKIPDNLAPGTYEMKYYIKDVENTWSDPWTMNFMLNNSPDLQFNWELKSVKPSFNLDSTTQGTSTDWYTTIPASEYLQMFNIWTRYPYNVYLQYKMISYPSNSDLTANSTINFIDGNTGNKTGNDILWMNKDLQIPTTCKNGSIYGVNLSAYGDYGKSGTKTIYFKVNTPINLEARINSENSNAIMTASQNSTFTLKTSKYVNSVSVTFKGSTYTSIAGQISLISSTASGKVWQMVENITGATNGETGIATFKANLPSGDYEEDTVNYTIKASPKVESVAISGYWNHWRGQVDINGKQLSNEPHRFLSLEKVKVTVNTSGFADKIIIRLSPQLEAMKYTDPAGHLYDYNADYFGHDVNFPGDSTILLNSAQNNSSATWEYSLPLAPATKSWDNARLKPSYTMTITAYKGSEVDTYTINDIEITGNVYDLTYIQPMN